MSEDTWNKTGLKFSNNDFQYSEFLEKTGVSKIDHYRIISFGSPHSIEFREEITVIAHTMAAGDKLSKVAFEYYGDAKLWWVLAWFNSLPTDASYRIGATIEVPFPLQDVLDQAFSEDF
jgi:hypothetical protein